MSDQTYETELRVNVRTDGSDGLTNLLNSLTALQTSVERLASSTEASYARIGKAAKDAEALKAAEAVKTEGIREREAAKTAATLEKLDAQTAANRAKLADQTAATQAQANAKSEAEAARHTQRMAVLAEQGAQAAAVAQARIAEIQARTNAAQLLAAQRFQAALTQIAAEGAQAQATAAARAGAVVTAEQAKAQAKQAVLAQENMNELAVIAAEGQAKLAEIDAKGLNRRNEIQLKADKASELEEQRSLNRRAEARARAMERMAASAGGGFGLGGMGSAILGAMGGKAVYDANVKDQGFYYTLLGMDNNDRAQALRDQATFYKIADDHGQNALKVAQQASGLFAAGKSAGLTSDQVLKVISGFDDAFQARHDAPSRQNRTLLALSEMLGSDKVQAGRAIRQMTADMPGLAVDEFHMLQQAAPNVFKTEADMRNVMEGKAGADGKKYTINPIDFVPMLAEYESKKWGPSAKEASETGVQSAMGKFQNALQSLLVEFGKAGAMDAFVNVMKELTATLKDPGVRASVHDMGAQLKEWSKNLGPLIQQTIAFIKTHKDGIETVGKVIGAVVAFNLAFKALVSPFVTLGGHAVMLGKNVGGVVTAFEKTASFLGKGLLTFLDAFKPGIAAYLTSFGGMIANGLKSALGAVASAAQGALRSMASSIGLRGLGIAAVGATAGYGAYQTYSSGQSVNDYLKLRDSKGVHSFTDDQLKDARASVEAAQSQWNNQLYWKLGGGKARKQEYDDLANQLQTEAGTRDMNKRVAESNAKKAADAKAAAEDKAAQAGMPPLLTPGADKKKKGRGEGGSPDIAADEHDAQADYSNAVAHARDLYELEEDKQKQLLRDGKLGFEEYYGNRRTAVENLYATEKKAAQDRQAADMAAEKEKEARAAKAGNARAVAAAQTRENTLATNAATELEKIEMARRKTLQQINDEHDKEAKAYQKMVDAAEKRVDKAHGKLGVGADVSDITDKYDTELKQARERGDQKAVDTLNESKRLDVAHAQWGSMKDDIGQANSGYEDQIQDIKDRVSQGDLSEGDAENQILAIKKQEAQVDLQILDNAKALHGPISDQLAINRQIREAKAQINQQSKMEQEIEKDIANDLGQAIDKVMTGKERPIQAGKQFLLTLSEQIEGKLSQSVADEIVTGLKNGFDQANGSSNILSQFLNGLENTLKTAFNSVSSSSGSSGGGGFLSTLFNGVSSLFGGGGGSDSSGGFNFTMPDGSSGSSLSLGDAGAGLGSLYGVGAGMSGLSAAPTMVGGPTTTFNMNFQTPNLGSFSQSQSQIMSGISTRLSMANLRS